MKYFVVIMDGAAGWSLPLRGGKTCLELADIPNLNRMAGEGTVGLARTVPDGMEPSSAIACLSVLGYDPKTYYGGRAAIEARGLGISLARDEVTFRCNLVSIKDSLMFSYNTGDIANEDARPLIAAIQEKLGADRIRFYPGVGFRHILAIKDGAQTLSAKCTPPHDITGKPIADYLPTGPGSELLLDLMERSKDILKDHPVNQKRRASGQIPATMVWLFWGTGQVPALPPFRKEYGLRAAMTSAVDLLNGLAKMAGIAVLDIKGVTGGLDNDYAAQAEGALKALRNCDLVVVHVEAPDEAGHQGAIDAKIAAIERIDRDIIGRLAASAGDLRMLITPDHPTPIELKTHCPEPVPFLLWGQGFKSNGARGYGETEAKKTGLLIDPGFAIMDRLTGGST